MRSRAWGLVVASVLAFGWGCTSLLGDFTVAAGPGSGADGGGPRPDAGGGGDAPSGKCSPNQYECRGVCVAPDITACAGCDDRCKVGAVCVNRQCACPLNTMMCGDECKNTQTDKLHCGGCNRGCLEGQCSAGKCQPIQMGTTQNRPTSISITGGDVLWINAGDSTLMRMTVMGTNQRVINTGLPTTLTPVRMISAGNLAFLSMVDPNGWQTYRVDLQSSGTSPVSTGGTAVAPSGLASTGSHLFLGAAVGSTWSVYAMLSTTPGTAVSIHSATGIDDLASDGTYVYVASANDREVRRMKSDGTDNLALTGEARPKAIAYGNGYVVWANEGPSGGSAGEIKVFPTSSAFTSGRVVATNVTQPSAIATDGQFVYWTQLDGYVRKVSVNGGLVENLAAAQVQPSSIALDQPAVWWTTQNAVMKIAK